MSLNAKDEQTVESPFMTENFTKTEGGFYVRKNYTSPDLLDAESLQESIRALLRPFPDPVKSPK